MENSIVKRRENKTYTGITFGEVERILNVAKDENLKIDLYYGNLTDNYIINNSKEIEMNNEKRKFIIIAEECEVSWTGKFQVILTDDEELVEDYKYLFRRTNLLNI